MLLIKYAYFIQSIKACILDCICIYCKYLCHCVLELAIVGHPGFKYVLGYIIGDEKKSDCCCREKLGVEIGRSNAYLHAHNIYMNDILV